MGYSVYPNRKMAWDGDGTVVIGQFSGTGGEAGSMQRGVLPAVAALTEHTQAMREDVNSDSDATLVGGVVPTVNTCFLYQYLLFPELRDIDGYYWNYAAGEPVFTFLSTSTDTTTGADGTWDALGTEVQSGPGVTVNADYRRTIQPGTASDVAAVLTQGSFYSGVFADFLYTRALHIYGVPSAGETPDRLLFLDAEASDTEFVLPLDHGDIGRGQGIIHHMKIKNNSATLQANTVQATCEALYLGDTMFTYSDDGINDQATKAIGNIAAGASTDLYVHMDIPDAQAVDLIEVRTSLTVASWS